MKKSLFYNDKTIYEDFIKEDSTSDQHTKRKATVDINKLLNRVKVNKKDEKKNSYLFLIGNLLVMSYATFCNNY